jgi:hypothetical protein
MNLWKNFKLYPKAIVAGVSASFVLSTIGGVVVAMLVSPDLTDVREAVALVAGLAIVALGGFVTSAMSPSSKFGNASAYGLVEIAIALLFNVFFTYPLLLNVVSILLTIPASFLGAYLDSRRVLTMKS